MRQLTALLLLLTPFASFAQPTVEPAVHGAAERLSEAQKSVYKRRALDIRLASPALLASAPRRPLPPQGEGWTIQHPTAGALSAELVAEQIHRTYEVEQFERSIGKAAFYTGLVMLGVAALQGAGAGVLVAARAKDAAEPVGAIAGGIGGVGLITMIAGLGAHFASDREVPLDVAQALVTEYNANLARQLGAPDAPTVAEASRPASTSTAVHVPAAHAPSPTVSAAATPASPPVAADAPSPAAQPDVVLATPVPVTSDDASEIEAPSPGAPPSKLGLELLESDGVRVVRVVHARSRKLKSGDVIVAIDEIPTPSLKIVRNYLARARVGDALSIRVRRGGKQLDVTVRI